MSDLIQRARQFASQAHERIDQQRKYTGQSYTVHLMAQDVERVVHLDPSPAA